MGTHRGYGNGGVFSKLRGFSGKNEFSSAASIGDAKHASNVIGIAPILEQDHQIDGVSLVLVLFEYLSYAGL